MDETLKRQLRDSVYIRNQGRELELEILVPSKFLEFSVKVPSRIRPDSKYGFDEDTYEVNTFLNRHGDTESLEKFKKITSSVGRSDYGSETFNELESEVHQIVLGYRALLDAYWEQAASKYVNTLNEFFDSLEAKYGMSVEQMKEENWSERK